MFVLTIDQRGSRRADDRVPELLAGLAAAPDVRAVLAAERTVGDEVQLVVDDAASVVAAVEICWRLGDWTLGVGVGAMDEPVATSTRAARGSAFLAAREAVERAKRTPARLSIVQSSIDGGGDPYAADRAEAALWLLVAIESRRTRRGWQVVDAVRAGGSQRVAAAELGVSEQAVSQVLQAAGFAQTERGRALAAWLLEQL
ncbi:MAG: transposase [Nocardioidaceae bacterium]|nr:transposase [Nocardioidaceae bacterium]